MTPQGGNLKKLLVIFVSFLGCDVPAKELPKETVRTSGLWESCATTNDCNAPARCYEQICSLPVNDLRLSVRLEEGRLALQKKDFVVAREALSWVSTNDSQDTPRLPQANCILSKAELLSKEYEKAARAAVKCLHYLPRGSADAKMGASVLAVLQSKGLDLDAIKSRSATSYLTKKAKEIPLTAFVEVTDYSGSKQDKLTEKIDAVSSQFAKCEQACGGKACSVAYKVKAKFSRGAYEEDDGYRPQIIGEQQDGPPAAGACFRPILETTLKDRSLRHRWSGTVKLGFRPQS